VKADLNSFTEVAQHALCDDKIAPPIGDGFSDLLGRVPDGELFVIETRADAEVNWRIYVDEPLPAELEAKITSATPDVLLRVPSGRLVASGLEYVGRTRPEAKSGIDIAPGNYLADIYERDVDWDRDIGPIIEKELGADYRREKWVGPLGGLSVLAGIIMTIVSVFAWSLLLMGIGLGVATAGIIVFRFGLSSGYEVNKAKIAMRFPSLVVVLRKLPDDADLKPYRGTVLGAAAVQLGGG
jgi:hypothetical protein